VASIIAQLILPVSKFAEIDARRILPRRRSLAAANDGVWSQHS
jgi:hypothetical protein